MKRFDFLICYDIANTKRLAHIAKYLEKHTIRIQKSIFYGTDMSKQDIEKLILYLDDMINEHQDDIRIYKVDKNSSLHLKQAVDLKQPNLLVGG